MNGLYHGALLKLASSEVLPNLPLQEHHCSPAASLSEVTGLQPPGRWECRAWSKTSCCFVPQRAVYTWFRLRQWLKYTQDTGAFGKRLSHSFGPLGNIRIFQQVHTQTTAFKETILAGTALFIGLCWFFKALPSHCVNFTIYIHC